MIRIKDFAGFMFLAFVVCCLVAYPVLSKKNISDSRGCKAQLNVNVEVPDQAVNGMFKKEKGVCCYFKLEGNSIIREC